MTLEVSKSLKSPKRANTAEMPKRVVGTKICNVEISIYIRIKLLIQKFTYEYLKIHFDDISCTIRAKY